MSKPNTAPLVEWLERLHQVDEARAAEVIASLAEQVEEIVESEYPDGGYPPEDTDSEHDAFTAGVSDDNWACGTLNPET